MHQQVTSETTLKIQPPQSQDQPCKKGLQGEGVKVLEWDTPKPAGLWAGGEPTPWGGQVHLLDIQGVFAFHPEDRKKCGRRTEQKIAPPYLMEESGYRH
jgi:hypothetical protein